MKGYFNISMLAILSLVYFLAINCYELSYSNLVLNKNYLLNDTENNLSIYNYLNYKSSQHQVSYLNNQISNINDLINIKPTDTILFNFENFKEIKCSQKIRAIKQLNYLFVHPKTCLDTQELIDPLVYLDANLSLNSLKINKATILYVNGYSSINKLKVNSPLVIISLGNITIDDLIISDNQEVLLLSLKEKVLIRHHNIGNEISKDYIPAYIPAMGNNWNNKINSSFFTKLPFLDNAPIAIRKNLINQNRLQK